ncbi:MAG: hypothetical protein NTY39_01475 [Campylobacterales bacterium]|nr:hypothetical protein [Campylobacterales bacterium]
MRDIRLIEAPLTITFEDTHIRERDFERDFGTRSETDDDAIGQWLRSAKAKGDTSESDPVVLHMIVELYRKMDRLEHLILGNAPTRIVLAHHGEVEKIGLEHFELSEALLDISNHYYGRLELPIHPRREVSFYFEALSPTLGKIIRMHPKDESEWGVYMRARERMMIRQLKGY